MLKPRHIPDRYAQDISWYMNETAERGGIAVVSTAGSGVSTDNSNNLCTYAADPSGKQPLGILMDDVNGTIDLTRTPLYKTSREQVAGGKVLLVRKGEFTTDMIYPGLTIAAHDKAYLGPSGKLTNAINDNIENTPLVGWFKSTKDESGYATVVVDI